MTWEAIAAFIALGITIITSVVFVVRGISNIEENLRKYFDHKHDGQKGFLMLEVDKSRTMFGETVEAIRRHADLAHNRIDGALLKVQQVELYIRDEYVEIDSFNAALTRVEKTIDTIDGKVDQLITRTAKL